MSSDYYNYRMMDNFTMKEEEKKRRKDAAKRERENMFPKATNDGIMKTNKPKFNSIDEIKDAQVAQKKLIDDLGDEQWNHITRGTDDMKIISGQKVDKAKQELLELDYELTAAYGLGPDGYWNNQSKNRQLDDVVHSYEPTNTNNQNTVRPTNNTNYAAPKNNFEADDWVMQGKLPTPQTPPKPATPVKQYDPNVSKSLRYSSYRDDLSRGAERQKDIEIAQKQDDIVNGQDLSQTKKSKLQDDLRTLNAEKNVIVWKQQNPNATSEDYDAKRRYFDNQINKASDDYVNEWGGKDTAEAEEAFAEYSEQVHGLVEQRDAFNRMKMGVDMSAVQGGGGGSKTVSLSVNDDEPMYVGKDEKKETSPHEYFKNFTEEVLKPEAVVVHHTSSEPPNPDNVGLNPEPSPVPGPPPVPLDHPDMVAYLAQLDDNMTIEDEVGDSELPIIPIDGIDMYDFDYDSTIVDVYFTDNDYSEEGMQAIENYAVDTGLGNTIPGYSGISGAIMLLRASKVEEKVAVYRAALCYNMINWGYYKTYGEAKGLPEPPLIGLSENMTVDEFKKTTERYETVYNYLKDTSNVVHNPHGFTFEEDIYKKTYSQLSLEQKELIFACYEATDGAMYNLKPAVDMGLYIINGK